MAEDENQKIPGVDRRKFIGLAATGAGVMFMKPELAFGRAAELRMHRISSIPVERA
jgi:hypothetical protein